MNRNDDLIIGKNAIMEALNSGREIDTLFVSKGQNSKVAGKIISLSKDAGAVIKEVDSKKLDYICQNEKHQGFAARVSIYLYVSLEDILEKAKAKEEKPFIVICDGIEDPHNLGAIIRSAECAGAHGVVIPERRSAGLNFTVNKAACGALEYIGVARVINISDTIDYLRQKGLWAYASDMQGETYSDIKFDDAVALVIGSEGSGISKKVMSHCDFNVKIPMSGNINSLNASVAAGVILFEIQRQRKSRC